MHAFLKTDEPEWNTFALDQLSDLPQAFRLADVNKLKREAGDYYSETSTLVKTAKSIVTRMLALSAWKEEETEWQYELLEIMMSPGPRKYVNKVLVGTLLSKKCPPVRLAELLRQACIGDLEDRTASLPQPPADWQRAVPVTGSYRNEWEMLRPFLESPTKSFYDYKQVQARRSHLEQVVRFAKVDLRMETIRTGSPHTLYQNPKGL